MFSDGFCWVPCGAFLSYGHCRAVSISTCIRHARHRSYRTLAHCTWTCSIENCSGIVTVSTAELQWKQEFIYLSSITDWFYILITLPFVYDTKKMDFTHFQGQEKWGSTNCFQGFYWCYTFLNFQLNVVFVPFQPMFLSFTLSSLLLPFLLLQSFVSNANNHELYFINQKSNFSIFNKKKIYVHFFNHLQKWLIPSRSTFILLLSFHLRC